MYLKGYNNAKKTPKSKGASRADFSTTGRGQLRAVKDGERLLSYESTSLAMNSTNPETPSTASTPSAQSQAPSDWGVRSHVATDGTHGIPRLELACGVRRGSGGGHAARDEPRCLPAVLVPVRVCVWGSSVGAGAQRTL